MIFRGKYQVLGLLAVTALFCSADIVMAQPGRGGRGGFGQVSGLQLLVQEGIQKELELVDDQIESLVELQQEQRDAMRVLSFSGRAGGDNQQIRRIAIEDDTLVAVDDPVIAVAFGGRRNAREVEPGLGLVKRERCVQFAGHHRL